MKKLYKITILLSFIIIGSNTYAQTPSQTQDLFNRDIDYGTNGVYYKDTQGYFNQYIGTWLYTDGTTSLKVTFQKKYFIKQNTKGTYFIDALVGEYEYIVNGVTIFNTLSNLNVNYNTPYDYHLFDDIRIPNYDSCYQCTVPRQRLRMRYDEPTNDNMPLSGTFVMHTITQNGQVKLYVNFANDYAMGMNWSKTNPDLPANTTQLTLPEGIYIFNKVN